MYNIVSHVLHSKFIWIDTDECVVSMHLRDGEVGLLESRLRLIALLTASGSIFSALVRSPLNVARL